MINTTLVFILLGALSASAGMQEPVIGGPCQGCEYVYFGMPDRLSHHARIAPADEPGQPLSLQGKVTSADGKPASGVVVYAYQTDARGRYPEGATAHGRLRGWALSDENGVYAFTTVRPGAYPDRNIAQHIHLHVIEPGKGTYYIDDVTFDDDRLLTQEQRENKSCRGGCGHGHPERDDQGVWQIRRDIRLGKSIPGY